MSTAKEIQAAQALRTKAIQKEINKDYDAAFELHVQAAEAFLHLAQTLGDANAKTTCKTAAAKALERAEQIKKVKGDLVRPVVANPYSPQEQTYIVERSSVVNGLRFPVWQDADAREDVTSERFQDPDGQPALGSIPRGMDVKWQSPTTVIPHPLRIVDPGLLPEDLVQTIVTDCSVIAALSVCLAHQRKFGSKLALSSLCPQNANGYPVLSHSGKYNVRVLVNGSWRKIVIDEALPFFENGELLGVSTGNRHVLWPALLEKAYMKLMGGYDFPGSNSGADLHTLIGWIPEHIHIQSPEFRMEGTWSRIYQAFKKGDCLLTLGSPNTNNKDDSLLLPEHNYAVFEMEDDGEQQHLLLHDPWSNIINHKAPHYAQSTSMRLTWRETCNRFDTIHLSWNPALFPYRLDIQGTWKGSKDGCELPLVSNRIRLRVQPVTSEKLHIWVLLTRHIVGKHEKPVFISVNSIVHEDGEGAYPQTKPFVQRTYSNGIHTLKRASLRVSDRIITIVASIEGASTDVRYTLAVLSDAGIAIEPTSSRGFYSKTITGTLSTRSSGGNHTYPTFMMNPQYKLSVRPAAAAAGGRCPSRAPVVVSAKGPKDLPLNVKVVWTADGRVTDLSKGDVVMDTGPYSYGTAYCERDVKAGDYTLIISAFEPRQVGPYEISLQSLRPFDVSLLPAEGAGMYSRTSRGAWNQNTAAGSTSFGRYNANPKLRLTVPNQMDIIIRLQLLHPSSATTIHISVFSLQTDGSIGRRVLCSGEYSDTTSGVVIPQSTIAVGSYIIVPSTFRPGIELDFQILLYSTGSGIETSWL